MGMIRAFRKALFLPLGLLLAGCSNNDKAVLEKAKVLYENAKYEEVLKIVKPLAEKGNPRAQNALGLLYAAGLGGLPKDSVLAMQWYTKAMAGGEVKASTNVGFIYDNGGGGVQQDLKKAAEWYTKAAEQGEPFAQYNLGRMYVRGEGVTRDYKKAVEWYAKAAEQGNARAQSQLGVMYTLGQGIPQNFVIGLKWAILACANASPEEYEEFSKALNSLTSYLSQKQIEEAQHLAAEFKPKK